MTRLQRLSLASLALTLLQVAWGAFTRGSGSGYGCKDRWPLCEGGVLQVGDLGGLLPRWEFEMVVEWMHRWIASVVVVLLVWVAVHAWRRYRAHTRLVWPAIAAVVVVLGQSALGAAVVISDLDADLVTVHLIGATTLLALVTYVTVNALTLDEPPTGRRDRGWEVLLLAAGVGVVATLVLGSSVHNFHAFDGWPLPAGQIVPEFGTQKQLLHYLHRIAAAVVWVYLGYVAWQVIRRERPRRETMLVHGAVALFTANVGLGAVHVFTAVSSTVTIVAHLGLAASVWTCLVAAWAFARRATDDELALPTPGAPAEVSA